MNSSDKKIINMLRCLSIDMIDVKKVGNPNMCISVSPSIYTIFSRHININTNDTTWIDRDQFICTSKELLPLIYSNIFMCGYDGVTAEQLKIFDLPVLGDSKVNGLDLYPSDIGIATSVGLALGERYLGEKYNQKRKSISDKPIELFNHFTYVLTTLNELMNGINEEALSFAANQKLGKLIILCVCSNVLDETATDEVIGENLAKKYESMGFYTQVVRDMDDVNGIDKSIIKSKMILDKPSLILVRTTQEKYLDNNKIYSSYFTKEEITNFKNKLQISDIPFNISEEINAEYRKMIHDRSSKKYSMWASNYNIYLNQASPALVSELSCLLTRGLKYNIISMYKDKFVSGYKDVLSVTNGEILQHIAYNMPYVIGGSIGEGISTHTLIPNQQIMSYKEKAGRNILFGTRKTSSAAILNGLALMGLRPYIASKLNEASFMIPAIKESSMLKLPTVYIFTYNSIQNDKEEVPISEIAILRSIPNLRVFMPCDAKELVGVWDAVLKETNGPSVIIVSNEETKLLESTDPYNVSFGAYVVKKETDMLDGIIVATGSSLQSALIVANRLSETAYLDIRVVSMPDVNVFESQKEEYKKSILPSGVKIIIFETANKFGIEKYATDNNCVITLNDYIPSYKRDETIKKYGLDYQNIETKVYELFK